MQKKIVMLVLDDLSNPGITVFETKWQEVKLPFKNFNADIAISKVAFY